MNQPPHNPYQPYGAAPTQAGPPPSGGHAPPPGQPQYGPPPQAGYGQPYSGPAPGGPPPTKKLDDQSVIWLCVAAAGFFFGFGFITGPPCVDLRLEAAQPVPLDGPAPQRGGHGRNDPRHRRDRALRAGDRHLRGALRGPRGRRHRRLSDEAIYARFRAIVAGNPEEGRLRASTAHPRRITLGRWERRGVRTAGGGSSSSAHAWPRCFPGRCFSTGCSSRSSAPRFTSAWRRAAPVSLIPAGLIALAMLVFTHTTVGVHWYQGGTGCRRCGSWWATRR